jgi:hypothetical protein
MIINVPKLRLHYVLSRTSLVRKTYWQFSEILDSLARRFSALRAHQNNQLFHVGTRIKQLFYQHFSHETRSARNENRFPSIELLHRIQFFHFFRLVNTPRLITSLSLQRLKASGGLNTRIISIMHGKLHCGDSLIKVYFLRWWVEAN